MAVVYMRSDTLTAIRTPLCRTQLLPRLSDGSRARVAAHGCRAGAGRRGEKTVDGASVVASSVRPRLCDQSVNGSEVV